MLGDATCYLFEKLHKEVDEQGLFRVSGDNDVIEQYLKLSEKDKKGVKQRKLIDSMGVHTVASLIKKSLGKQSSLLVSPEADDAVRPFFGASEKTESELLSLMREQLQKHQTEEQRAAFRFVAAHFYALVAASDKNKMTLDNLMICVGPALQFTPGWMKWAILKLNKVLR